MTKVSGGRPGFWIAGQCGVASLALFLLAFAPPEAGQFFLVPLDGQPVTDELLDRAMLGRRAPGPLPGSVIADGQSSDLFLPLLGDGILLLAAPAALCADHPSTGKAP